ncbi:hypothetical protein [Salinimonas lutimaris]|uniref:hypothetical protein n=1 Tax=Salinimonas lutimaris TaxID=914153 RepID=UPI0010BF9E2B|nr:hypothetical protein [Salinimonas lutimaris]
MENDSNQTPESKPGRMQQALDGQYQFSVKAVFTQANKMVRENYATLFAGVAVILGITVLLITLLATQFSIEQLQNLSSGQQLLVDVIVLFLIAPVTTGFIMLGAQIAQTGKGERSTLFRYVPQVISLVLAQLLISIVTQLGLYLLILPGLYVFIATSFTLPLVADKRMTIFAAMLLSVKMVNTYLSGFIGLFLLFGLLFVLSAFTFGLALLWVMPLYYAAIGLLYNDLFGSGMVETTVKTNNNESTFDA